MKNERILRNAFISVSLLLALTWPVTAAARNGVLNFSERPSVPTQPSFITFDLPNSVNGTYGQAVNAAGLLALAINASGIITGAFFDSNVVTHGFLRISKPAV